MKLYRVSATGDFGGAQGMAVWVTSKRQIPAAKKLINQDCSDDLEIKTPLIETIDVPRTKAGLVKFLNVYAAER